MKILVYGDVSPNIIDGSSIWLSSIVAVLADLGHEVHVLLKYKPTTREIVAAFENHENVVIEFPRGKIQEMREDGGHTPASAVKQYVDLMRASEFSVVLVRGLEACLSFSETPGASDKLWSYVTDLPFPPERISKVGAARIDRIARNSRRMLAQTEAARCYLEAIVPSAAGQTLLLPPMIPDSAFRTKSEAPDISKGVSFVYSGKFAHEWRTEDMLGLPLAMAKRGIPCELHVIGNKFQASKNHRGWNVRMRNMLEQAAKDANSGVRWHGGVPRDRSLELVAEADFGIGWRTKDLDSSLEISTKALEYGAVGTPPIINRTADHELLYGSNYPFFVDADSTVEDVAELIVVRIGEAAYARELSRNVSEEHSMASARDRWRAYLEFGAVRVAESKPGSRPLRVLVAGHDFKFLGELLDRLDCDPALELLIDKWTSLHKHDESASLELLGKADVILCEWAGPNLVWYSNHVNRRQRLICRLHGFELRGGTWFDNVDFEAVDTMVFVSDMYRQWALRDLPLSESQATTVPNMLDSRDLDRPKNSVARFNLGLVGYVPFLKRPDRAVDLLERLLEVQEDYNLIVKGRPPWEYPHHWQDRIQAAAYLDFFARIRENSKLRESIRFDRFSPDIGSWLRNVGVVLSPSEHESFHLAPAEGMASGSLPVVWQREGANDVFPSEFVHDSLDSMVVSITEYSDKFACRSAQGLSNLAASRWDISRIYPIWFGLLDGSTQQARPSEASKR